MKNLLIITVVTALLNTGCNSLSISRSRIDGDSIYINHDGKYITRGSELYTGAADHLYENNTIGAVTTFRRGLLWSGKSFNREGIRNGAVGVGRGSLSWCYPNGGLESLTKFNSGRVYSLHRYNTAGKLIFSKKYRWEKNKK
jgi:hypothetical protein